MEDVKLPDLEAGLTKELLQAKGKHFSSVDLAERWWMDKLPKRCVRRCVRRLKSLARRGLIYGYRGMVTYKGGGTTESWFWTAESREGEKGLDETSPKDRVGRYRNPDVQGGNRHGSSPGNFDHNDGGTS